MYTCGTDRSAKWNSITRSWAPLSLPAFLCGRPMSCRSWRRFPFRRAIGNTIMSGVVYLWTSGFLASRGHHFHCQILVPGLKLAARPAIAGVGAASSTWKPW